MKQGLFLPSQGLQEPSVNLTPLIDVVFVILIMFIVISPLLNVDQIDLASAGTEKQVSAKEVSHLSLHVRSDNTIWYQNKAVTLDQLPLLFQQVKRQHPKIHPQIYFDKKASFGTYQAIKNTAESAHFEALDLILKPT